MEKRNLLLDDLFLSYVKKPSRSRASEYNIF